MLVIRFGHWLGDGIDTAMCLELNMLSDASYMTQGKSLH